MISYNGFQSDPHKHARLHGHVVCIISSGVVLLFLLLHFVILCVVILFSVFPQQTTSEHERRTQNK